jgi:hypothetical protein
VKDGATPAHVAERSRIGSRCHHHDVAELSRRRIGGARSNGIREGAKRGQLFIDMSTINPIVSQKIARELSLSASP